MTNERFLELVSESFSAIKNNCVTLPEEGVTLQVLDAPLVGFASASDPLFSEYKDPEIIGPEFRTPAEYMPGAKAVAGFFFPFTEEIRAGNRLQKDYPSGGWLHGRIEGQAWLTAFMKAFV